MTRRNPPTIDDVAVILPALVRALGVIVEQLEPLVDLSCQATNLSEETADLMADIGNTLTEHSRVFMREGADRRQTGPGRAALKPGSGATEPPAA